jgi:hypothetical protein
MKKLIRFINELTLRLFLKRIEPITDEISLDNPDEKELAKEFFINSILDIAEKTKL